jgi:prolyl-tRNA synthetase
VNVLLDDRLAHAGKKLADAELIACRQRVVISRKAIESNSFEWMNRRTLARTTVSRENIAALCVSQLEASQLESN